jgi:hypothetical protein
MRQRKAVAKAVTRHRRGEQADKGKILDEVCAMTGWHRNHACKAPVPAVGDTDGAASQGVMIERLEDDQDLQEAVLSL